MTLTVADRRWLAFAAAAIAVFIAVAAFTRNAAWVEAFYVRGAGPWLAGVPQAVSRVVPFSLAELVIVALVGGSLVSVGFGIRAWRRGARPSWRIAVRGLVGVVAVGFTVADVFYLVWGIAYGRPSVESRWGWAPTSEETITAEELTTLAERLVDEVNDRYEALHGSTDAGAPTGLTTDWATVDAAIDRGFATLPDAYGLDADLARSRGRAKRLVLSQVTSLLRIGGFYFPFTGEANVNAQPPDWGQPFTVAHEKAHQRFVASENEANFYGFVACIHSDDLFVQYSGYLFAQRQVLRALGRTDPEAFDVHIRRRHPGVQRDVDASYRFWTGYQGPLANASRSINDAYLRANGVAGGVQSYGRSLQLIVRFARDRAGRWPPAPPAPVGEEM